jgi:hypothetical protein
MSLLQRGSKVVSGFRKGTEIYLAVWNLKEDGQKIEIPIQEQNKQM